MRRLRVDGTSRPGPIRLAIVGEGEGIGRADRGLILPERTLWLVNGHEAAVEVWSPRAWRRLAVGPVDAQSLSDGSRVLLRMV